MTCRICLEDGGIMPCNCSGTHAHVHEECLQKWLETSGNTHCELCGSKFVKKKTCKCKCSRFMISCLQFRTSSNRVVDSIILSFSLMTSVVLSLLMPETSQWLFAICAIFILNAFFVLILLCQKVNFYPMETLSTFLAFDLAMILITYIYRKNEYNALCKRYCPSCAPPCIYFQANKQSIHQMFLGLLLLLGLYFLSAICRGLEIACRECKTEKILGQERHRLI